MKTRDLIDLVILAALWGGSFLFMRLATPEFGAVPLIFLRVTLAALILLPLLLWRKKVTQMKRHALPIAVVGVLNSAIPFSLIAYSTLFVTAGFASILNAATPIFTAIVAFAWLGQRLGLSAVTGLFVGLLGVVLLVWDKLDFSDGASGMAIVAGISASLFYGIAAVYSKKHLVGVNPLATATGSMIGASLFLLPPAIYLWPESQPSMQSWLCVLVLALFCTGLAYLLYFRLIESAGPSNATTVTFLMPAFGMFWGYLFLDETVSIQTIFACAVILLGTGLTLGFLKLPQGFRRAGSSSETG